MVSEARGASREPARGPAWGLSLFVVVIGAFMAILDSSIVNIAIPTIENVFGVDTQTAQWVVTIYILALGVVVPASAWLGERFGLKRVYIASLVVFTAGSALCGAAWSLGALTAFRVIQALGGGLIMPTTMSMVYRMVPRERIGTAMGFWGLALIVAPAIGPTLGGYLVEYVDWRLIFYVNVPIGIIGTLLALTAVPDFPRHPVGPLDWPGLLTAAGGLFGVLLALSEGPTWGWGSEAIVLLFIASGTLLAVFAVLQLTGEHPLLDLRVFRYGSYTIANLVSVIVSVVMYAGIFYVPLFLQTVVGYGAMQTGLIMMPAALVTALFMPVAGRLYDRIGARGPVFAGMVILAVGTYFLHNLNVNTPTYVVTEWLMFRSVGMGLAMMPLTTAAMSAIPTPRIGAASSINNIIQRVASSFGLAVLTSLLTTQIQMHAANLAAAVVPGTPGAGVMAALGRYFGLAGVPATELDALTRSLMQGLVERQAFVMGIDDLFVLTAALSALAALLALGVRTYRTAGAGRMGPPVE